MMVTSFLNGSSADRLVCDKSKSRPTFSGAHRFLDTPNFVLPAQPCTISIATSRTFGADAALASFDHTAPAGSIASSTGRATVTPIPFRTARRDKCFLVINMTLISPR